MEIDITAPEPSYLQLARWLRDGIKAGQWKPGETIPSITQLSERSGLAQGTVRKAIGVLKAEGLVNAAPGRGTYVTRTR